MKRLAVNAGLLFALLSQPALAAKTYLMVFLDDAPLSGVELDLDGAGVGLTNVRGSAEIDIEAKRYDAAIKLLEKMLSLSPDNHPTTMTLGRAYFEGGYFGKADRLLSRHTRQHPGDANLWYLLAEVQGKGGNILGLHQSRAEYFALNGAMEQAIEQLNYALPLATNAVTAERIHTRIEYFHNIARALKNFG